MQISNTDREKIIQNLKDCDCDEAIIEAFMEKLEHGQKKEALTILAKHRQNLLDLFHRCDGCIGCLDYLTNQIENKKV
ncbi:MAG: hypothetical protein NC240_10970 [Clostridium sp.]|nr:hypothetical protein [Clostridium sp.]